MEGCSELKQGGSDLPVINKIKNTEDMLIYIPFYNKDMVDDVVATNVFNALSKVATISVVCNPLKKGAFLSAVEEYKEEQSKKRLKGADVLNDNKKLKDFIQRYGPLDTHESLPRETKRVGEYRALQNISIVDPKK